MDNKDSWKTTAIAYAQVLTPVIMMLMFWIVNSLDNKAEKALVEISANVQALNTHLINHPDKILKMDIALIQKDILQIKKDVGKLEIDG